MKVNKVILTGRLVANPELKFLAGAGTAVSSFTIAVEKGLSKAKKEEFKKLGKATADFPRVKVFGKTAEAVANYTEKGKMVLVEGSIQTGSYEKQDGTKVYTTDVLAQHVEFLEWKDNNNSGGNSFNQDQVQTNFNQTQNQNGYSPDGFQAIEDDDDIPFN